MQLLGNNILQSTEQTNPLPSQEARLLLSVLSHNAPLQPSPCSKQSCANIYSNLHGPYIPPPPPALDRNKSQKQKVGEKSEKYSWVSLCLWHKISTT